MIFVESILIYVLFFCSAGKICGCTFIGPASLLSAFCLGAEKYILYIQRNGPKANLGSL